MSMQWDLKQVPECNAKHMEGFSAKIRGSDPRLNEIKCSTNLKSINNNNNQTSTNKGF